MGPAANVVLGHSLCGLLHCMISPGRYYGSPDVTLALNLTARHFGPNYPQMKWARLL